MQLQTKIPIQEQSPKVNYSSSLVLLGSCFVENIGKKFDYFKLKNTLNPFGITFHPLVLERLIKSSLKDKSYSEDDVFQLNERWHCYDAHSVLSDASQSKLINNLNLASKTLKRSLTDASHIVVTLGTAWGYVQQHSTEVVNNCHKVPQKNFKKTLASVDELVVSLKSISATIKTINPEAKLILTVSPVRHIKDGFVENTQSKAHLISAVHKTISVTNNTAYFPSYEIMMDELRDYRFYSEDMLHPSQIAVNYIWDQFIAAWFSQEGKDTLNRVNDIQRDLAHRPFNPSSDAHQKFIKNLQEKIEALQKDYPQIKF
ncbi:GSCFA domain-containing protein [Croceibacter atlanticus]|uniref:GSCFA domain-containing protein n=1 Tax=Croceibacter atlanticus TaxID=313588 RepID=UPI002E0F5DA0|nr:GSCFA domain-containing protein [Croceibacter atlanticus]